MPVTKKKSAPKKKTVAKKKTTAAPKTKAKSKAKASPAKAKASSSSKAKAKSSTTAKAATTRKKAPAKAARPKSRKLKSDDLSFTDFEPYQAKKGEDYMNDAQVDHFRSLLNSWKRELMEEVDRTLHYMQDEAANFPDPNDRASQESDFTMELRTRDRERKLIKKIDESMELLESGDYGYCDSCGIEIGIRRLEARPTATLCIDCKTLDEIRERQLNK
jgi:DnaK suppressor protein